MLLVGIASSLRSFRSTGDRVHGFVLSVLILSAVQGVLESALSTASFFTAIVFWSFGYLAFRQPDSRGVPSPA
jgi:hypothetical protein